MVFDENEVIDLSSSPSPPPAGDLAQMATDAVSKPSYLATLDRAAMEAERLQRVNRALGGGRPKRERELSSDNELTEDNDEKAPVGDFPKRTREDGTQYIPFPKGIVKKTAVSGYPRIGDDITIEEVLQPRSLRFAALSAFQWDFDWIFDKLFLDRTKIVLVVPAKTSESRDHARSMFADISNIRVCLPKMPGVVNCMHSKLQLLVYDHYMRVCIPSANMTSYDWGEDDGVLENIMYIHDFLLLPEDSVPQTLPPFAQDLIYFLEAQDMFEDVITLLKTRIAWQNTENVRFVHSIGGEIREESKMIRTGYPGLSTSVKGLVGTVSIGAQIDYVVSSLGSLTNAMVENIFRAATGRRVPIGTILESTESSFTSVASRMRVYFPSHDTVSASKGGISGAGTICFSSSSWNNPAFPKQILRDGKSVRQGCLMHDKVMFVRFDSPVAAPDGTLTTGMAYVGSANMSQSAWGKLVNDRSTKRTKLVIRNWECGVLIRVPKTPSDSGTMRSVEDSFQGIVPVPMKTSSTEYGSKLPWFFRSQGWGK
ncbi:tyrosyl-DNA phosphodiesterase-domain-containing protein [Lipomyces arxii]|uniref:tyrosyl-DNA phosphodiesterase-domain-containing protein n=1 Tax=Lipomyces arxii TaxID=56418 RepID=UPI0034CED389